MYKAVEHEQRTYWLYNVNTYKSLSGQNCKTFGFAPKEVTQWKKLQDIWLCSKRSHSVDKTAKHLALLQKKSLSGQNCKTFGFALKDVLSLDTFLKTMICVSFSVGTFTILSLSLFPRFPPNPHIYLYASTMHMYCIYPAILNRK